jgi:hypothetical protein
VGELGIRDYGRPVENLLRAKFNLGNQHRVIGHPMIAASALRVGSINGAPAVVAANPQHLPLCFPKKWVWVCFSEPDGHCEMYQRDLDPLWLFAEPPQVPTPEPTPTPTPVPTATPDPTPTPEATPPPTELP